MLFSRPAAKPADSPAQSPPRTLRPGHFVEQLCVQCGALAFRFVALSNELYHLLL